ncbi:deaminase [Agreia sp. COWG]|uniref:deaminase n=1 Tax=Agreia sp. COWG TaxID=2773266 RepID=UPI0019291CBA|nr:deaminase [Agreia sp. COWG]CAD6003453.1 putative dCMP deaminase [Agreia sp. COWG]
MLVDVNRVRDFEIVLGFVAPIGTDLDSVIVRIKDELKIFDYGSETIRLSHLLDVADTPEDSVGYYKARMDKGDELRRQYGSGDALAAVAAAKMISLRGDHSRERRFAWILRTLKHEDEVALLRQTYGRRFILIGAYQEMSERMRNLSESLKGDNAKDANYTSEAAALVRRDEMDPDDEFGQQGRDTYAQADYFIDLGKDVVAEVARLVGLLFGEPFLTPNRDEVAMFHAFGAALRSADPGRQVGAAITTAEGELLSTGSNEVPKAFGGEYWTGDPNDARDYKAGYDYSKKQTRRTLSEILTALSEGGFLDSAIAPLSAEQRLDEVLASERAGLKRSRMMSLIEFGRVVHAEMSALTQVARLGISVHGATLYTTAFPCHMCMRLIISSGIARIVYVDPYPKSLAFDMYADSISSGRSTSPGHIPISPFCGASWNIYPEVFSGQKRKRDGAGRFVPFEKTTARMRLGETEPLMNAAALEAQIPIALSALGN